MKKEKLLKIKPANLPNTKELLTKEMIKKTGRDYIIKMNYNENKYGCTSKVRDNINILSPHIYPEYLDSDIFKTIKKISNISKENIYFSNGSDSILDHIPKTFGFLKKNPNVVIPSLTYGRIETTCSIFDLEIRKSELKNWKIDLDSIYKLIDKNTTIVYIVNPNMPTGTYNYFSDIVKFIKKVNKNFKDVTIVIDEAYIEYAVGISESYKNDEYLISNFDNVIITRTFSKLFGLASFRIGYCFASKENIEIFRRTAQYFPVSKYSYQAAHAALNDINFYNNIINKTNKEKDFLYKEFNKLNLNYIKSYGNFIFINLSNKNFKNSELEEFLLQNYGLLIRSVQDFALRITIGTRDENKILIKGMKEFLKRGKC